MPASRRFSIEMAGGSATIYLNGRLTLYLAARTLHECGRLPPLIRHLRIDMRAVRVPDGIAIASIAQGLRRWRDERNGATRIDLPHVPVSFAVLAAPRVTALERAS